MNSIRERRLKTTQATPTEPLWRSAKIRRCKRRRRSAPPVDFRPALAVTAKVQGIPRVSRAGGYRHYNKAPIPYMACFPVTHIPMCGDSSKKSSPSTRSVAAVRAAIPNPCLRFPLSMPMSNMHPSKAYVCWREVNPDGRPFRPPVKRRGAPPRPIRPRKQRPRTAPRRRKSAALAVTPAGDRGRSSRRKQRPPGGFRPVFRPLAAIVLVTKAIVASAGRRPNEPIGRTASVAACPLAAQNAPERLRMPNGLPD